MRGASRIEILSQLQDYIDRQEIELAQHAETSLRRAYVKELKKDIHTAKRLEAYIMQVFNKAFSQEKRRCALFGNWRKRKIENKYKGYPTQQPQQHCRHCGAETPPKLVSLVKASSAAHRQAS